MRFTSVGLAILLAIVVSILVWLGIVLMQRQSPTQTTAAATIAVSPAFAHYYRHHVGIADVCKNPLGRATFLHGVAAQHFEHCTLIAIYSVAPFPIPTTPPLPSPVPTIAPTEQPAPTVTPRPIPTLTPIPTNDPIVYLLDLINRQRASHGYPAYALSAQQTPRSQSHADAMAKTQNIWHVNPTYPADSFPQTLYCYPLCAAGENVGEAYGSEQQAIAADLQQMLSEPWSPGCAGNHACNLLSLSYRSIGIGITYSGGVAYVVQDFIG